MIEKMIAEIKQYLPLKIMDLSWDGDKISIQGHLWSFNASCVWRVISETKVDFGCYDYYNNPRDLLNSLKLLEIVRFDFQCQFLKIDPVFMLSNGQKSEDFFSHKIA